MQLRSLGRTGLKVSPLMLGGNVFGWTADQSASFAILNAFVAAGGNLIDTANEAQVALARLMARKSATTVPQVQELVGAMDLQLDANVIDELNKASAS
jgi:aryl-alcohol dehydrogenase-like predicted oxidoreductase